MVCTLHSHLHTDLRLTKKNQPAALLWIQGFHRFPRKIQPLLPAHSAAWMPFQVYPIYTVVPNVLVHCCIFYRRFTSLCAHLRTHVRQPCQQAVWKASASKNLPSRLPRYRGWHAHRQFIQSTSTRKPAATQSGSTTIVASSSGVVISFSIYSYRYFLYMLASFSFFLFFLH